MTIDAVLDELQAIREIVADMITPHPVGSSEGLIRTLR
jgi:hypothetical protein